VSLRIENLSVTYGKTQAVDGLALDVESGERFAVMGSSGSGKSSLLRAIAGLLPIDSGSITIDGTDMTGTPAHRRPVGLMFQDYALFPHMTVSENIGYGLRMEGIPAKARDIRSRELLDLVGLEGFADRKPSTLSGGEQQRVALARTLAPQPSIVLLDEPLGSLDISLRESLLAETREILDAVRATSMYVTHDRGEAFSFCDRMAIMHDGELLRVGTPDEIWRDPRSEFVARAIGQTNLIAMDFINEGERGLAFVPRNAITVHSDGRHAGTVVASRFEDGAHVATVGVHNDIGGLEMTMAAKAVPGSRVDFDIDSQRIIYVSPDKV
jgi:ABC-type Fe3+/spermidine/putrescine transport system ATPase subunit